MSESAQWEDLSLDQQDRLHRLRVPGGWVYRSILTNRAAPPTMGMVFVPDETPAAEPRRGPGRPPKSHNPPE